MNQKNDQCSAVPNKNASAYASDILARKWKFKPGTNCSEQTPGLNEPCQEMFENGVEYKRHLLNHHQMLVKQCLICGPSWFVVNLERHVGECHGNPLSKSEKKTVEDRQHKKLSANTVSSSENAPASTARSPPNLTLSTSIQILPKVLNLPVQSTTSTSGMTTNSRKKKRPDSEDNMQGNAKKVKTEAQVVVKTSAPKKPSKRAACIFCKDGKMHPNIYKHLYECENYDKSVEQNRLVYSTCTELVIVNGVSIMCGHRCESKLEFMHHHWNEHGIYYYACRLCDYKLFRDIRKHHKQNHGEIVECPFNCDYRCTAKEGVQKHIKSKHVTSVYINTTQNPYKSSSVNIPKVEVISPGKVFANLPSHYEHKNGKFFHTIYDSYNRRNILSSSILFKIKIAQGCFKRGRKTFEYDKQLHTVQPSKLLAPLLECDASHLESAMHYSYNKDAFQATFLNSNLTFMKKEVNRGIWKEVEEHQKKLIQKCDYTMHIKGAIYDDIKNKPQVYHGGIKASVPTHFFAVIYMVEGGARRCQVFLIPNSWSWANNNTIFHHLSTFEEVEFLSGLWFRQEFKWKYLHQPNQFNAVTPGLKLLNLEALSDRDKDTAAPHYRERQFRNQQVLKKFLEVLQHPCPEIINPDLNQICGYNFRNSRKRYIAHYERKHKQTKYVCEICPGRPICKNIQAHHDNVHSRTGPIICNLSQNCNLEFKSKHAYAHHIKHYHGAQLGMIQFERSQMENTPSLTDEHLENILENPKGKLYQIEGEFFHSVIDIESQQLLMTITILQKQTTESFITRPRKKKFRNVAGKSFTSKNYKFQFSKSLSLAQLSSFHVNLAGYQAGHMESANMYQHNSQAYFSTFVNTNLIPMFLQVNNGLWQSADCHKKKLLNFADYLRCISGAIYNHNRTQDMLPGGVIFQAPTHFYIIILIYRKDADPKSQVFLFPNSSNFNRFHLFEYKSTIENIEKLVGFKFKNEIKEIGLSWDIADEDIWRCDLISCTTYFQTQEEKDNHKMITKHSKDNQKDPKHLDRKKFLNQIRNKKTKFQCEHCPSLNFKVKSALDRHKEKHLTHYQCDYCPNFFKDEWRKQNHLHAFNCSKDPRIFNADSKTYVCVVCNSDQTFCSFKNFQIHVKAHKDELKSLVCTKCNSRFSRKIDFNKHLSQKPIQCSICLQTFCTKNIYLTHVGTVHKDISREICVVCDRFFFVWDDYINHLKTHYLKMKQHMKANVSNFSSTNNNLKCNICGSNFNRRYNLRLHLESPQTCSKCGLEFCSFFLYQLHARFDHKMKHKCNFCEWSEDYTETLRKHYGKWHQDQN